VHVWLECIKICPVKSFG